MSLAIKVGYFEFVFDHLGFVLTIPYVGELYRVPGGPLSWDDWSRVAPKQPKDGTTR